MNYEVFITDQCSSESTKHGAQAKLAALRDQIVRNQNIERLETHLWPYFHEKVGDHRVIIEKHELQLSTLLCFKNFLTHDEYDSLRKTLERLSSTEKRKYYDSKKINASQVEEFLSNRNESAKPAQLVMSQPEQNYLTIPSQSLVQVRDHVDPIILETELWCERIVQPWAARHISRFASLVEQIGSKVLNDDVLTGIRLEEGSTVSIYYRHFPNLNRTILIAPVDRENKVSESTIIDNFPTLDCPDIEIERRQLEDQVALRAYPLLVTFDQDIWMQTQSEESLQANLALSVDENRLLYTLLSRSEDGPQYPLFINGRAGSGKSTILQFLFANHLDSYLRTFHTDGALNPPLYLTYNYHLLDRARKTVHGILKATAHTLMDAPSDSAPSQIPDGSFKTLRQLFRSAISFRDQSGFVDSNLMTYHRFREFWTQRSRLMAPQVSKLRPALLWHVIRTYIKGMAVKSVDGYRSLATADQSVSSDTFQLILEKVWPLYNKHCVDNQLWDDQDLARQVLDVIDSGKVKVAAYPAIFCDEAQDFTHLELSLLNKFLLYSYRDMSSCRYLMKNIPFAFAGDPFQTLNPTGFSWSSIKSTYHRNVVQRLDPSNEAKLILNDQDLPVNYRSSAGIVRFANTIQFLRSKLLGHEDLRPQDSWRQVSSDCSVKYFDVNDENCKDNLRNESSLLIIVPCDEEGEADYRQSDEVLLDIIGPTEDDASRLASPSKVKGLEFDRVLLYRFGDFACKEHPRLVRAIKAFDSQRHEAPSDQDRLVWEYFLNKLYVAVSRARLQLIVVDSVSALNGFWQFALEDSQLRRSLIQLQGGNAVREIEAVWRIDRLGTMEPGISSSWTEITDDPGRVAQAYEAQGRLERNPRLLRDAKSHYRRAGKSGDMNLCEAAALEIEGSLQDAAKLYENEGRRNEAARCYWAESNWDKLVELGRRFPSFQSESLYRCSDIIRPQRASNVTADEVIDVLRELVTYRNNTAISEPDESQAYSRFIGALVRHLDEIISSRQAEKDHWSHLPECVEEFIADLHIQLVDVKELPNLYASCGHTSRAYDLWREINPSTTPDRKVHPRWIVLADAKRRRFPERVKLLAELDEHDAVVDSWIEEGRPVNRHECTHVVLSALRTNRLDVVGELVSVAPDLSDLCACSMDVSSSEPSVGKAMLVIAMSALASTGEWLPMIEFSEGLQQKKGHPDLRNLQSQWKWPRKMRIVTAIQILARCPELEPSKSGDIQNFLIRHFLPHLDRNRRGNASSRVGARLRDDFKQAKKSLGIAEVGAAIEAFCLPQTACKYWELYLPQARRSPQRIVVSEQTYELAKRRWIVCAQKWQSSWVGQGVNLAEKRLNDNLAIWKMNKINVDEKIRLPPIDLTDIETIAAPESLPKSTNVETESTVQVAPTVQSRQGSSSERQGSSPEIVPASPELPSSDPHPEEMPTRSRIRSEIDEEVNRSVGTLKAPRTECSLTLRFDGRVIDGLIQIPKRRIQLTDSANDDVVFCGSGDVVSHDLQVMEIDAGRVWEVIDWGVSCQIDDLGGERAIRIFSGSDELLLGFIFPESSGE